MVHFIMTAYYLCSRTLIGLGRLVLLLNQVSPMHRSMKYMSSALCTILKPCTEYYLLSFLYTNFSQSYVAFKTTIKSKFNKDLF